LTVKIKTGVAGDFHAKQFGIVKNGSARKRKENNNHFYESDAPAGAGVNRLWETRPHASVFHNREGDSPPYPGQAAFLLLKYMLLQTAGGQPWLVV
jgi:hypothetical protein